jgi:putative tricarboxylic transport membrane protein
MLEDNFSRAMQLEGGIGFILERPMTMGLLTFAVLLVALPTYRSRRARIRA